MKFVRKSPLTLRQHTMDIEATQEQVDKWQSGTLIQDAFPDITAEEREFILKGITPEEWDQYIKPLEEDDR